MMCYWREHAIITLRELYKDALHERWTVEAFKKSSSIAYPFGERRYTPYKIWLQERKRFLAIFKSESWWNKEQYQEKGGGQ